LRIVLRSQPGSSLIAWMLIPCRCISQILHVSPP
jgi:hypothetical protein